MSKAILWFGFVLSIFVLFFALFIAESVKPLVLLFWLVILGGSGYRLFFNTATK